MPTLATHGSEHVGDADKLVVHGLFYNCIIYNLSSFSTIKMKGNPNNKPDFIK
jgi:hypothetical protein